MDQQESPCDATRSALQALYLQQVQLPEPLRRHIDSCPSCQRFWDACDLATTTMRAIAAETRPESPGPGHAVGPSFRFVHRLLRAARLIRGCSPLALLFTEFALIHEAMNTMMVIFTKTRGQIFTDVPASLFPAVLQSTSPAEMLALREYWGKVLAPYAQEVPPADG